MTSRHLVDRELVAMLDSFPSLELTDETVRQMRTMMKEMRSQMAANLPTFPDISGSSRFVPGPEGAPEVLVLVYLPTAVAAPLPALLWVHGGSVMGEASQDDLAVSQIVSDVGCVAVSVDYRLAPETPHPGPVEDGYAALRWLSTYALELRVDPTHIAIGGANAGGDSPLDWCCS